MKKMILALFSVTALLLGTMNSSFAQYTLTTLASFNGSNGNSPQTGLTLSSDGNILYGTTYDGGAYGAGTVFSIPVSGGAITTLASFNRTNGGNPTSLILVGKTLYGTTYNGGAYSEGTVFSIPVGGGAITTLASFNGTNGASPTDAMTLSSDGKTLYGVTEYGGPSFAVGEVAGTGTVFAVPVGGGAVTTLASFNGINGRLPNGGLTLSSDGRTLYGTTWNGGAGYNGVTSLGFGTVFSLPVTGGVLTTLANFNGSSAAFPAGGLILIGSTLYGTASGGGSYGYGIVFSIPVAGGIVTTLANFDESNNESLGGLKLSRDGTTFYGTTWFGGTDGFGSVFSVPVGGGAVTTLASFNASNGAYPMTGLTLSNDGSTFYGTASGDSGGSTEIGNGTIFSLTLVTWQTADVTVGSDDKTRLLWTKTDGTAGVWTVDNSGNPSNLTNFGPFTGWTAASIASGADGLTRMLWNKTDGTAGLWILNSNNTYKAGFNFGPYAGWSAVDVAVGSDNKARLLWTKSDGTAGVWTVDNNGVTTNLTNYGPFPGWTATRIAAGSDGYTRLLWNKTDGTAALWILNANNTQKSGFNFGPFYGTTAVDVTVGADNKARLLWINVEGQVAVWTVDNSGNYTNATSFGPDTGWIATKIAVGGDGLSRLLWSEGSGPQAFWLLNSNNSFNNGFNFGPY